MTSREQAKTFLNDAIRAASSKHTIKVKKALVENQTFDSFMALATIIYGVRDFGELYYLVLNDTTPRVCSQTDVDLEFVSPSVGYKFCGPASKCECAKSAISAQVSATKSEYSKDQREQIKTKRSETNKAKFGSENVFSSEHVKAKIRDTNLQRYGVENPQQHVGIRNKTKNTVNQLYGVDNVAQANDIRNRITTTNLSRYGTANPASSETVREKMKSTVLKRYGVTNIARSETHQEVRHETNRKKYGVTEPFNTPESKRKAIDSVRRKFITSFIETASTFSTPVFDVNNYVNLNTPMEWQCLNCGVNFFSKLDNNRIPKCQTCHPKSISSGHRQICDMLDAWGIGYVINDRTVIKPKELDIWIPSHNLAIEFCGLYWHTEISGGKGRNYHLDKLVQCEQLGVRLITIFDDELEVRTNKTLNRLRSILKVDTTSVQARKCKISQISASDSKSFMNSVHLMEHAPATVHYGLFDGNELISVMTFSPSRFDRTGYELVRYASSRAVVGGAQRLFKQFLRDFPTGDVVSYADRRWSDGGIYFSLGFELDSISNPGYWYLDKNKKRYHRLNFTKKKLIKEGHNPNETEWQIMQNLGYDRIWDCGQLVFRFKRK